MGQIQRGGVHGGQSGWQEQQSSAWPAAGGRGRGRPCLFLLRAAARAGGQDRRSGLFRRDSQGQWRRRHRGRQRQALASVRLEFWSERLSSLPLPPCGGARAYIVSAVRVSGEAASKKGPVTLPAMRLRLTRARSRREAPLPQGRGERGVPH